MTYTETHMGRHRGAEISARFNESWGPVPNDLVCPRHQREGERLYAEVVVSVDDQIDCDGAIIDSSDPRYEGIVAYIQMEHGHGKRFCSLCVEEDSRKMTR